MGYRTRLGNIDTYHTVEDYQKSTTETRAKIKAMFPSPFSVRVDIEINCPDLQIEYFEDPKKGQVLRHIWLGDMDNVRRFMGYYPAMIYQVVDSAYKNVLDWLLDEEQKAQSASAFLLTTVQKKVQIEMSSETEPVKTTFNISNVADVVRDSLTLMGTQIIASHPGYPITMMNTAQANSMMSSLMNRSIDGVSIEPTDSGVLTTWKPSTPPVENKVPARRTLRPSDPHHPKNRNR